ncbi:hypothetical protein [Spiroplasma endosymbiont of Polydrusus pterygomalis]|uniref:hypothetical protein n=1 Tax=Spiroplasma endosymbiont of Polydrusus pterygomalis TaxID=3139327 RepID=UPI003CCA838A
MKTLLKLLGTFTLATSPAMALVACNSENKEMTPRDILNSAAAFITDSDLGVKFDLQLPDNTDIKIMKGKTFSQFADPVKTAIADFFANKLKKSTDQHPTNWYHPDAGVKIMDIDNEPKNPDAGKFVLPVKVAADKPAVNGHLLVKAEISYSNLPPITKNIKLTLNNDTKNSNDQAKADAIREFIKNDIANLNVNVENLPINGIINGSSTEEKAAIAKTQLSYIQQNLNVAIKDKVQYSGLRLSFAFTGDFTTDKSSTLFTMQAGTLDANDSVIFNGDINNITISFLVGAAAKADFNTGELDSGTAIKINQTFVDATTQIEKVFSDWTVKPVTTLPTATEKYDDYNKNSPIEDQFIRDGYFAAINKVYANLGSEWLKQITITNRDSHFNLEPSGNNGYFSLNFKLEYDLKPIVTNTTSKFNINVEDIHIKLHKI